MKHFFQQWLGGIRVYLTIGIGMITLQAWWWTASVFDDGHLAVVRLQEIYGWFSVALLAATLLVGPVTKAFVRIPGKQQIRESRRMIGIGAAWFAILHAVIAYLGQFPSRSPLQLPKIYQLSLLLGVIGVIVLILLSATSFNAVMRAWGVWWFRLHRLVYVTALAALMHAFMIGAHATSTFALISLAAVAALWLGFNIYFLIREPTPTIWKVLGLCYGAVLLIAVLNYGLTQHLGYNTVAREHSEHLKEAP